MGREELALALTKKGESEARAIWQRAETAAGQYRAEQQQEVARQCRRCDQESEQSATIECLHLTWRLAGQTRRMRLQVLQELDQRMQQLAVAELAQLQGLERRKCQDELIAEIPAADWVEVRCHPDDCRAVQKSFADSQIETDETVVSGLVVSAEAATVQIDNSLPTRLETLWPGLCGQILLELEGG